MASENDARHGTDYSLLGSHDAMFGMVFYAISGIKKLKTNLVAAITWPTSENEPSTVRSVKCRSCVRACFLGRKWVGNLMTCLTSTFVTKYGGKKSMQFYTRSGKTTEG